MLAIRSKISGTPFSVLTVIAGKEVFRGPAPWQILMGLAAISLGVIGAGFVVLRSTARNLVLSTQLAQESQQKEEIVLRNRQLDEEILQRETAPCDLRKAHDARS